LIVFFRSFFPLSVTIFLFLKKKQKGFPLLSGLTQSNGLVIQEYLG